MDSRTVTVEKVLEVVAAHRELGDPLGFGADILDRIEAQALYARSIGAKGVTFIREGSIFNPN